VRSRAGLLAILLLAMPLAAQTDGGKPASVQGTVTDSVTGLPVPRAHVSLQGTSGGKPARYGATSGADGKFAFTGLTPGNYMAQADRVGFVRSPGVSPRDRTMVDVKADENKTGIEIKLTPTGAIIGRVVDSDGEPVEDASVSAQSGRGGGSGTTDEKGLFRIGGLAPGKYSVRASGRGDMFGGKPEIRTDGTTEVHNASTYYPGVTTQKEAAKVDVRAGGETSGIDIQLARVPFVRLGGRVIGLPGNAEDVSVMVSQGNGGWGTPLKSDGSFELWRLDPGKYTLSADWAAPNGEQVHTAGVEVEVAGSNIENIELRVVADSDIPGRLEFEDDEAKQIPREDGPGRFVQERMVTLEGVNESDFGDSAGSVAIDADGAFHLKKVPAGKYRVRVSWGTAYVKSMRLGSVAIDGPLLDLSKGSGGADLSILMGAANGSLSGTVQNVGGDAAAVTVVLTVDGERGLDRENQYVEPSADGTYSFDHLAPGNYLIVAVPEDDMAIQGNKVLGFEDQMESVKVGPKEKVTKDLKLRTRAVP